ncbi:MAG: Gfo/Idh/MocA family oxidoreductase [Flavobacteriaceae bacterium]|nr:MAG: Gfo/Idh/MocA family oxidoreductase [Flavobacteriaceae bacterium]
MGKTYNWAILGCGKIARKFVNDLKLLKNAKLYAAASRSVENAQHFADELGFEKAYGSYREMVEDPEVDVVYIATPHAYHMEHSILCLNHKKAVLCEKAFAMNVKEVDQMIAASRENETFLMEAFWTIFQPKFKKVLELAKDPELGRLNFVKSDFMFNADFDPDKRLYNIDLGAGSLLDIGIYPIFRSMMFLGKPLRIKTMANIRETGVEDSICMLFDYEGGEKAVLTSSFESTSINETELCFEHGFIKFERDPEYPIILGKNGKREEIDFDLSQGSGYELEAAHVMECMDKGITESPILSFGLSRDLMEIMDRVRKEAGIVFPKHDLT